MPGVYFPLIQPHPSRAAAHSDSTFKELFEASTPALDVDFKDGGAQLSNFLPMPKHSDPIETAANKMEALASIVRGGKSLAVHTGCFKAAADEAQARARSMMTDLERRQFEVWREGAAIMPAIDWSVARKPVAVGDDEIERC